MSNDQQSEQIDISKLKVKSTSELDWFDFETRIRLVMRDMIEPILERNNDDREDIKRIETLLTNYDRRIDELEFLLNRSDNKTTKYDMLHDHIVAVESSLKLFTNENSHNVSELKISLDSLSNTMEFLSSQSKSNAELIKKIQDDQFNTREHVIGLKNEFLGIANNYWKELIETIRELEAKTLEIKDWAEQAIRMSKENTTNIESIFRSISSIGDMSYQNERDIKNLAKAKLDFEVFNEQNTQIQNKFREFKFSSNTIQNCNIVTDEYIDFHLPFLIQFMISKTLHGFLNFSQRKKLLDQEQYQFAALKQKQISHDINQQSFDIDFKLSTDSKLDKDNIDKTEANLKEKLDARNEIIKRDRLDFMKDWNELRKKNEEQIIKQADNINKDTLIGKDTNASPVKNDQLMHMGSKDYSVTNNNNNNELNASGLDQLEPLKNLAKFDSVVEDKNDTANLDQTIRNSASSPQKMQKRDSESEISRAEGVNLEVFQQLRKEWNGRLESLEEKMLHLNVYTERIFGGMTEEIIKLENKHNNNASVNNNTSININNSNTYHYDKGEIGSKLEETSQQVNKLIQNSYHLNAANNYTLECLKMILTLMAADEVDRESFGLQGIRESLTNESKSMSLRSFANKKDNVNNINQSALFESQRILEREKSFLPEINQQENLRQNQVRSVDKSGGGIMSNISLTPLPKNLSGNRALKQNFSNLNSNLSLRPSGQEQVSVSLSNKCLSCVGNKALVNQAFKLACLNYIPSKVNQRDKDLERKEMFMQMDDIFGKIQGKIDMIKNNSSVSTV